jgi:hypothetical protein
VIVHRRLLVYLLVCGTVSVTTGCSPTGPRATGIEDSRNQAGGEIRVVPPTLTWKALSPDQTTARVELIGADPIALAVLGNPEITRDEWSTFLAVRIVSGDQVTTGDNPPIVGSYTATNDGIRFEPRFPLEPGVRFRAQFDPVQMHSVAQKHLVLCGFSHADWVMTFNTKLSADFSPPQTQSKAVTRVVEVYPTGSVLPENLLRFYIHFSAPMSRGEAYARIQLLDANDHPVSDPFLELAEELWSNDGTRFTLLFDPGRIKRGLKPREQLGPVLEAGKAYTLAIDREWLDAHGNPLANGFRKLFRAGPADETMPDPKTWKIEPPDVGTQTPLEVRFPEALDRALLDRLIAVKDDAGSIVRGQVSTTEEETAWRFTPREPWRAGTYRLAIATDLEDVAGNSVARPFEVDATSNVTLRVTNETVSLPFRIGPLVR